MYYIKEFTDLSRPVPQAAVLLAMGLLLLCFRQYRQGSFSCALGVVWIGLCATPTFVDLLQRGLENAYPFVGAAQYPTADAIVVLGGGDPVQVNDARETSRDLRFTRPGFGLALFRQRRAPIVVLSGGGNGEALEMSDHLQQLGVPPSALRLEAKSLTTHQNALYSAAILKREGRRRILLVTSAWAMQRAAASFRHEGIEVIPAPSRDISHAPQSWPSWRVSLWQSARFLHEYTGLLFYKLRGWA